MEGVWEPARVSEWQHCPVASLDDRGKYQFTIKASPTEDGLTWTGGRPGSFIAHDNFHGTVYETNDPNVFEGKGHDNTHGDYPARFTLMENGELHVAFGEGFFVKYFLTRGGESKARRRESTLGDGMALVLYCIFVGY